MAGIIPKTMSFFWSDSPMSWLRYLTLKSFRVLHPDWEIKLYTCATANSATWKSGEVQDRSTYAGMDYFDRVHELDIQVIDWVPPVEGLLPPAHACDICQWDILSSVGGFYSDMDILYVKPVDYEKYCGFDILYCLSKGYMTIGFFGASPANAVFDLILREAVSSYDSRAYQTAGAYAVLKIAGIKNVPGSGTYAMNKLMQTYPHLDFVQLKDEAIYPWPWDQLDSMWKKSLPVPDKTIGIHWFGGATLSQQMNLRLSPDTIRSIAPCTLTSIIISMGLDTPPLGGG